MPRRPGVYFYRDHFVTKFGCGDGPPIKLAPAKNKSDRDAIKVAEEELRRLVRERDESRTAPKAVTSSALAWKNATGSSGINRLRSWQSLPLTFRKNAPPWSRTGCPE